MVKRLIISRKPPETAFQTS